jgi:hypothetical protein
MKTAKLLLCGGALMLAILAASVGGATASQDDCKPWQHKNADGDCVDNPGVTRHHGHYEPSPAEQCWDECLCYEGEYPRGNSCSPCSFVGTVCMPL